MNKSLAATLRTLLVLVLPAAAVAVFYAFATHASEIRAAFAALHVLTLLWVAVFFRRRLARVSVLPVSFLVSPAVPYIHDTMNPGWFQYIGTMAVAVFYAIPWAAIALIVAVITLIRSRKNRSAYYELPTDETQG